MRWEDGWTMIAADRTLLEQARELQALAQTGLAYCKDPLDRERYERIRAIAVDMLAMQADVSAEEMRSSSAPDTRRRNSILARPSRPRLGDAVRVNPITVREYCHAET